MFKNENTLAWLAFAAVSIFWGTTYFAIRVGVTSFPPFIMASCRHLIGGILICAYFVLRGYKIPSIKELGTFAVNGILMLVGGNGLISWGMQYVDSGVTAIICALTPIWIVIVNKILGSKEKIGIWAILGFVVCLMGQVLIFKNKINLLSNNNYAWGIAAVVFANISWALGTIYSKNNKSEIHSLFAAGLQMIPGGLILFIIAAFRGELYNLHPNTDALLSVVYLIIVGSILAYGSFMYVLKRLPAAVVSTYAYINTVVAILIGWLWLHEELDANIALAAGLTIIGVYMVTKTTKQS